MNPDFPEVGTLVSAGLAAKEIDALSVADRHGAETGTHHNCLNCGTALSTSYCGSCGQPAHLHRSLLHLSEEFPLSFMSLLFTVAALLAMLGVSSTLIALCVIVVPPIHMFAQLRGTYGLGLFAASWRTIALLCICGTAFVLFLLFVVAMTLH